MSSLVPLAGSEGACNVISLSSSNETLPALDNLFACAIVSAASKKRRNIRSLQQAALGERYDAMSCHDKVIEGADVDQCERLLERLCEEFVGARRLGHAGRMVMRKNDRGRVMCQRGLHNLPGIDARLSERASEELVRREQSMLTVEKHHDESLVR